MNIITGSRQILSLIRENPLKPSGHEAYLLKAQIVNNVQAFSEQLKQQA